MTKRQFYGKKLLRGKVRLEEIEMKKLLLFLLLVSTLILAGCGGHDPFAKPGFRVDEITYQNNVDHVVHVKVLPQKVYLQVKGVWRYPGGATKELSFDRSSVTTADGQASFVVRSFGLPNNGMPTGAYTVIITAVAKKPGESGEVDRVETFDLGS